MPSGRGSASLTRGRNGSCRLKLSKPQNLFHRLDQIVRLRQDLCFELRVIAYPRVHRGDAFYRSVEVGEEFVGDAGGDLGSVTETQRVFVRDEHATGFDHTGLDGLPVIG